MARGTPKCVFYSAAVAAAVALLAVMQAGAATAACPPNPPGFEEQASCPVTDEGATCTLGCPANTTQRTTLTCMSGGRWQAQASAGCMTSICRVCQCESGPIELRVTCAASTISPQDLAGISPNVTHAVIQGAPNQSTETFSVPAHLYYYAPALQDLELSSLGRLEFEVDAPVLNAATPGGGRLAPHLRRLRMSHVTSVDFSTMSAVLNRLVPNSCRDAADLTFDLRNNLLWAGAEAEIPWRPLLRARRLLLASNTLQTLRTDAVGLDDICCLHELDASGNNLTELGSTLVECDELRSLELQDNALTHIRKRSINLQPTLTHLNLTNNAIAFIDTFVFDRAFHRDLVYWRSSRQALHMAGNPSTCTLTTINNGNHYVSCACANGYKDVPSCMQLGVVACGSHPSTSIEPSRLCDGTPDCPDGWDERQCAVRLVAAEETRCTVASFSEGPCSLTCRQELRLAASDGYVNVTSSPDACEYCPLGIGSIVDASTSSGTLGWASFSFELVHGFVRMRGSVVARESGAPTAFVARCNELYRVVDGSWLGLDAAASATARLTTASTAHTTSTVAMASKCPQRTDNFLAMTCQRGFSSSCIPQCIDPRIRAFPITCNAGAVWSADPCLEVGTACGGVAVLSNRSPRCTNTPHPVLGTAGYCNVTCTDGSNAIAACDADADDWRFLIISQTGQVEAADAEVCGLKSTAPSAPSSSSSSIGAGAIVGIAVGAMVVALAALIVIFVTQRRQVHMTNAHSSDINAGSLEQRQQRILHELERCNVLLNDLSTDTRSSLSSITRSELTLDKQLGRGAFGVVNHGLWLDKKGHKMEIAAKMVTAGAFDVEEQASFLVEAQLMSVLSHPSLVRVLGLSVDGDGLLLVMEFLQNGNLRDYLRNQAVQEPCPLTAQQLLEACIAIADGMAYLAARNVVHRDLACRNILVGTSLAEVKISDYGMARYLAQGDYYRMTSNKALPIAWMAPESIANNKWSPRSDVWSAGITFWELFSLGETPFSSLSHQQILNAHSAIHVHLSPPPLCPRAMYGIIAGCWKVDPNIRPSFDYLLVQLTRLRDKMRAGKRCNVNADAVTSHAMSANRNMDVAHGVALTSLQSAASPVLTRTARATTAPRSAAAPSPPPAAEDVATTAPATRATPTALAGAATETSTGTGTTSAATTLPTAAPTAATRTEAAAETTSLPQPASTTPTSSATLMTPTATVHSRRRSPGLPMGSDTSTTASLEPETRRQAWLAVAMADNEDEDEETRL